MEIHLDPEFYSQAEIDQYGVVAIEFELITKS